MEKESVLWPNVGCSQKENEGDIFSYVPCIPRYTHTRAIYETAFVKASVEITTGSRFLLDREMFENTFDTY